MYKHICFLSLIIALTFPSAAQLKGTQNNSSSFPPEKGKSKMIRPEGKTPFPYRYSVDIGMEDKSGDFWVGTSEGIYRYDGKLFTNYQVMDGLYTDHVSSMLRDKAGNMWFGAFCGIVRYDPSATVGKEAPSFTAIKIRAANSISFLADLQESINAPQDMRNPVSHMAEDKHGAIWFSVGYHVYRTDGKSIAAITTSIGDFLKLEKVQYHCAYPDDFGVSAIYEDQQGNILISTQACSCGPSATYRLDAGSTDHPCILNTCHHNLLNPQEYVLHYKEIATSFRLMSKEDGKTNIAFTTVLQDKGGTVWIGSDSGVYRYDGTRFLPFIGNEILRKGRVTNIYQDKNGSIWFGTGEGQNFHGNGVFRYDPSAPVKTGVPSIVQFTVKDGLFSAGIFKNDVISGITEDKDGNLWISGDGGASHYDGKGFISLSKKDGFTDQPVRFMNRDKAGNIWLGTWELGLYRYDGKSLICYTENKPGI